MGDIGWQAPPSPGSVSILESKNTPAVGLWSAFMVSTAEALTWQWKVAELYMFNIVEFNFQAAPVIGINWPRNVKSCTGGFCLNMSEFVKNRHLAELGSNMQCHGHGPFPHFQKCRYYRRRSANKLFCGLASRLWLRGNDKLKATASAHCALLRPGLPYNWESWLTSPQDATTNPLSYDVVWSSKVVS